MKNNFFKKSTAFLLAMSMIFSLFMVTASAQDDNSIRVLVRIETPDKTLVYPERIWVDNFSLKPFGATAEKTSATALHALITALGMDETGPDNGFSVDTDTGWINQVSGYQSTGYYSWMYAVNDEVPDVGCSNYQIKNGDEIVFYYIDSSIGAYSYFLDTDKTATTGEKVNVNLFSVYWDATKTKQTGAVEKADILVSKAGEEDATINTGVTTDNLGHAQLTFNTPGTYIVSALRYGNADNKDTCDISRPRMTVTVTGNAIPSSTDSTTPVKPVITTSAGGKAVLNADGKTINITADEGYEVADVTVNSKSVGAVSQYVLSDSEKNATIHVTFAKTVESQLNDTTSVDGFIDVVNHWALDAIKYVTEEGLFYGTTESTFSPNAVMTRGMFVSVLGRFAKVSGNGVSDFTDVNEDEYYAPYVAWAAEKGIVSGTSANTFAPNAPITREQAMTILYKYADFIGSDVSNIEGMAINEFSDVNNISAWAKTAVRYGLNASVIRGRTDGSFDPQGTATRAEIATMLQKFIEHIN